LVEQQAQARGVHEGQAAQVDDDLVEAGVAQLADLIVEPAHAGGVELAAQDDDDLLAVGEDRDRELVLARGRGGDHGRSSGVVALDC